jgi:hypothetical protein
LADDLATTGTRDGSLVFIGRRFTADALARSLNAFGIHSHVAIKGGSPRLSCRRAIASPTWRGHS